MRWMNFSLCLLLISAFAVTARSADSYSLEGTVRAVLSPTEVVVAHEEIAGFMAAMTMAFAVEPTADQAELAVGDRIAAVLVNDDGQFRLTDVRKVGETSP